jgi:hypothetical protein
MWLRQAEKMPQLFEQLTSWLWREDERGNLGTDDRTPVADTGG